MEKPITTIVLSKDDTQELLKLYDKNYDGEISLQELAQIVQDYESNKLVNERVRTIISKYVNKNGEVGEEELKLLKHELSFQDTGARYVGYSAVLARFFRYLAFTSDFGEALRPVVNARIVTSTYAVAIGYCFADIGWEGYKLHKRGYKSEKNHPMTMTQCVVERATFHSIASLALPAFLIHSTVDLAKKLTKKIGRFQKWGPTLVGLSVIPLLPLYLDHPVEHAIEWGFERFGPWASKSKAHKD